MVQSYGPRVDGGAGGARMDQDTLQRLAAEIANRLPSYPLWQLLLIQVGITGLAAAAGAFFGEYFRTRGRNLATKADFDSLTDQLRITTETVETIRAEVSQKDWAKREWTNLRRVKLEELLTKMHDCEEYLDRVRHKGFEGSADYGRDPISELTTIGELYFPELGPQIRQFVVQCRTYVSAGSALATGLVMAGQDLLGRQKAMDRYTAKLPNEEFEKLLTLASQLRTDARLVLVQIMGVSESAQT